jgi:hypothetical protein
LQGSLPQALSLLIDEQSRRARRFAFGRKIRGDCVGARRAVENDALLAPFAHDARASLSKFEIL